MKPDFKKMELIPAIVQDYQTNQILMLAYVNEEAYNKMLETKQTYFYSRSRKQLWHKGETSGHFQNIKGMYLDCDLDTLLIFVEQIGVACHTGAYSCFFNEILPFDNTNIKIQLKNLILTIYWIKVLIKYVKKLAKKQVKQLLLLKTMIKMN